MTENDPNESIRAIRKAIKESADMMKELVDDPSIMDNWTPVEVAWMREHLELLVEQATKAEKDIKRILGR